MVLAEATVTNPADPDLWHRLTLGETLWETGHFPAGDAFSYLSDYKHVADHEWGSALIFYALYSWDGTRAFVITKIVTLGVTMALLVMAGLKDRRPTALLAAFYAVILLALLPSFQSTVRCMTFTHIFFALWLYWFQCERHGRHIPTAFYVLTMVLWANLHGGYAIGLAWLLAITMLGVFLGTNRSAGDDPPTRSFFSPKKWTLRFGLCTLVTLINPFGAHLWLTTIRALVTTRRGFDEWAPVSWWPEPWVYPGYKLLLLGIVALLTIQLYRRGWSRIDRPVVILLGLFIGLSLTSARHTSLFAAVAGALAPGIFPAEPRPEVMRDPLQRLGYIALCITLVLIPLYSAFIVVPGEGLTLRYDAASCPVQAVAFLQRQDARGKLLVPFNYGSYAMWELRGQMRVSMDGRYDLVYKPETYQRVDDFFFARGDWPTLLVTPKPDAVLVPIADAVYPKLLRQPGWTQAWHDRTDAVFLPLLK